MSANRNHFAWCLILAATILGTTAASYAQTQLPMPSADTQASASTVRLSFIEAVRFALMGNREIEVVSYSPKQSQEDLKDAEAVYDPLLFSDASFGRDPNLETSVNDIVTEDNGLTRTGIRKPLGTGGSLSAYLETRYGDLNNAEFDRVYKNMVAPTIELRQPLLNNLGGKKEKTAIRIAGYKASISREEFRQEVIETVNRVARAYWQLYLSRELIAVNRENLRMAEEIHRRESERLASGISQQLDVQRAKSNILSRRVTLLNSQKDYRVTMDQLKLLINYEHLKLGSVVEVIPVQAPRMKPLLLEEDVAIETALKHRPEILKIKQEVLLRKSDEELAAHQRLPKFDAYGRYGVSGYGEDFSGAIDDVSVNEDNVWEVGFSFEWAIGNRSARSQYQRKKLKRLQTGAQLKSLENDIRLDIKQVFQRIAIALEEIHSTRLAKEAAEMVVEGEFARFDIGQANNLELFRAQDLLASTSRRFLRAVTGYNIALHDLEQAQGFLPQGILIDEARR